MAVRIPDLAKQQVGDTGYDVLGHEIAAEKAGALGRAGTQVEQAMKHLLSLGRDDPERPAALSQAARAVHAYFIQRELCGMRRHDFVIREYGIPREVLVRLGAS